MSAVDDRDHHRQLVQTNPCEQSVRDGGRDEATEAALSAQPASIPSVHDRLRSWSDYQCPDGDRFVREPIVIPPTPAGLASALSALATAVPTTSPDRVAAACRQPVPAIVLGNDVRIPSAVSERRSPTGIVIKAPATFDSLFVCAPLAYYLHARVVTESRTDLRLDAPTLDSPQSIPAGSTGLPTIASLLRRVYFLDQYVHACTRFGLPATAWAPLDGLELEPTMVANLGPAARLRWYLDTSFDRIDSLLPPWHLTTYIESKPNHIPVVPALLGQLSLIGIADGDPLTVEDVIKHSLADFVRGQPIDSKSGPRPLPDRVTQSFYRSQITGWLATGVPVDAFKALPTAYFHRNPRSENRLEPQSIAVVLNDSEMDTEESAVGPIYRRWAQRRPLEVTFHTNLSTAELTDVLTVPTDFLHYIGHCTANGLECSDGHLPMSSLDQSRTTTFFLNACGSYYEGIDLINRGSVAGAVTLDDVLNEQATKVGTGFAQYLMRGFSFEQALAEARCRAVMNKQYAVVGDGSYSITLGRGWVPGLAHLGQLSANRFHLTGPRELREWIAEPSLPPEASADEAGPWITRRSRLLEILPALPYSFVYDGTMYSAMGLARKLAT